MYVGDRASQSPRPHGPHTVKPRGARWFAPPRARGDRAPGAALSWRRRPDAKTRRRGEARTRSPRTAGGGGEINSYIIYDAYKCVPRSTDLVLVCVMPRMGSVLMCAVSDGPGRVVL